MLLRIKKEARRIFFIFSRYIFLVVLGFFLPVLYSLLTPLTLYPTVFLLNLVYTVKLKALILLVDGRVIELVEACIALSAYYLLVILNLSTPIAIKTRIKSLFFSLFLLLIINIFRIFLLSILYIRNFTFFDITHKLFWYSLSIIFVVAIWFFSVALFKIKNIPVYSDLKFLAGLIKNKN